jgi:hypothetical protein
MGAMNPGLRVRIGKKLGILEHLHPDGTCAVRLINENEWPFPEWVYVHQSQVKRAYQPKRNLNEYEEAPY